MFSAGFRNLCSAGVLACVMALGFAAAAEARGARDTKWLRHQKSRCAGNPDGSAKAPIPEKRRQVKKPLKTELSDTYRKWLVEDVYWIITDEERSGFLQLWNDEERNNFIEAFWRRRIFGHTWLGP
jgi:hypothetical protein